MSVKKFRWSQVYESSEEELITFLQARKLIGERVHVETGNEQTDQRTKSDTTIWCAEGSLKIKITAASVSLQPGDALQMDANTVYAVHPGIADCVYYLTR